MHSNTLSGLGHSSSKADGIAAWVAQRIGRWHELSRQRRQLARLDERTLRDIGVSHYEARQEARRWFWDDPLA